MKKLLIILGLVILLVTPLRAQDEEEEEEMDGDEEFDDEGSDEGGSDEGGSDDGGSDGGDSEYVTKGEFVETDGKKKQCDSHEACYDQREPQSWCILKKGQSWTDKGCFCEDKMKACVIERKSDGKLQYAYCAPQSDWKCSYD